MGQGLRKKELRRRRQRRQKRLKHRLKEHIRNARKANKPEERPAPAQQH